MKYADLFEKEAGQHITALRSILAGLETSDGDGEVAALVSGLRHESHGLAGVASAVGLESLARLMGAVEAASVAVTKAGVAPSGALVPAIYDAVEAAETLGHHALEGRDPPGSLDIDRLIAAVRTGAEVP